MALSLALSETHVIVLGTAIATWSCPWHCQRREWLSLALPRPHAAPPCRSLAPSPLRVSTRGPLPPPASPSCRSSGDRPRLRLLPTSFGRREDSPPSLASVAAEVAAPRLHSACLFYTKVTSFFFLNSSVRTVLSRSFTFLMSLFYNLISLFFYILRQLLNSTVPLVSFTLNSLLF